jgi:hypothetical protein
MAALFYFRLLCRDVIPKAMLLHRARTILLERGRPLRMNIRKMAKTA